MFHENHTDSSTEPGVETINNATKTVKDSTNHEVPETNHDLDVPANVIAITPKAFYWTKGYIDGKPSPVLAAHSYMAPYLAAEAARDPSNIDDLPNAKDVISLTKALIKAKLDELRIEHQLDQSGWRANGNILRQVYQRAAQAQVETVYWKDQLAEAIARAEKKNVKVSEDRSCQVLSGFRDGAIRNAYVDGQLAIALTEDGLPPIDLLEGAKMFLRMRAASETKRLLAPVNNSALETALDSKAARAADPTLGDRAAALKAAMEAAKTAKAA